MASFKRKTLFLCMSSIASLAMTVPAGAQDQSTGTIEEVHIVGSPIRDSQQAAITTKREADNLVDVVSADTIGRFPDQNLADSLGRLPGVAIERDQGQARFINLRGMPFRYTAIAFDGIDVPGAQNGRIPRFDSFPSVITSQIDANKAVLPSMPGESVAGFINIHTFNPFSKEGFGLATDFGLGKQNLGDGDMEKLSARASWSNDQFGMLVFASENSREQITDTREYDLEEENGQLTVHELDYRSYKVKREDSAHGAKLEFRGENTLERLYISHLYSEFVDNEERNQFVFDLGGSTGVTADNVPTGVSRSLEYGQYTNSTESTTLGTDLNFGAWNMQASATRTETGFNMFLPIPRSMGGSATSSYDLTDREDPLLYLEADLSDIEYAMSIGLVYTQNLDVTSDKLKFDLQTDFTWFGQNARLEFGGQYDQKNADGYVATPVVGGFPVEDVERFDTGELWDSNATNSIGGTYYDNVGLRQAWESAADISEIEISSANMIAIDEDIAAIYAMSTTDFSWGNFVFGARIEQTDYASEGTLDDEFVAVSDSFTNVLPSAHVNVDLAEDVKFRISASSGVNRPIYNEWRAAASIDVANQRVSGGNPYLKAEEATGLDTSIEWYFSPASLLSASMFYRSIDNVIYADSEAVDGGLYLDSSAGEQWTYTGSVNGSNGKLSGVELNFVGHARDLMPETLDGFGVSANVTALDSEFDGIDGQSFQLPGTSDLIYNASIFYENYGLSTRLNYQYRDEWISPIEAPDEFWEEQQRLDLSIGYDLPMDLNGFRVSVYANANNLTNETDNRYAGNGTINQSESYGRRYLVGVRVGY